MRKKIYDKNAAGTIPDKRKTADWIEEFFDWLFRNGNYGTYEMFRVKEQQLRTSLKEIAAVTVPQKKAAAVVDKLFKNLEKIYENAEKDIEATLDFDPAAKTREEVVGTYPGFFAVCIYRVAHELWKEEVPVIPRLMSEYVHGKTGIDIHPGAQIGTRFVIDHGTGVVIGETAVIGNKVKIYQGVTLGALSVRKDKAEQKRHPTIGDEVTIYANATILGGATLIGSHTVIGGNVWITGSVPAHSLVYHKSEISVKNTAGFPEPINFVI